MTLALYGGSFNPPHNGHVALARNALETLRPDRLIWMPSGDPPHKALPPGTPSAAHRLEMSRLAAGGLPGAEVSDFELTGGARYTIDTVSMLMERYKPDKLWLLMGSDMRESFDTWYRADELRKLAEVYVFPRNIVPVSSTDVRRSLDGANIPLNVWGYIQREGLYGCPKP
jgi:nicotinate-nucleotide adenylyltransferase